MIRVENLTKRYGGRTAVDNISFEVAKGEIVGFLGPNGAGKSTTMKILASYLPATSGTAWIGGDNVFEDSLKTRSRIGYMPENVPLYMDMRVTEYLKYRGALKGIGGRKLRDSLLMAKEVTNLQEVENRIIGTLSRGFRQRVGLADALLHEPDLLILDEPTAGLDPNQIRQVRDLIKSLGKSHTILLSTHILSEVEMTCSRVIIINKGKIEASDTPENLVKHMRTAGGILLEAKTGADDGLSQLKVIPGVKDVSVKTEDGWNTFQLRLDAQADPREDIYRLAVERRWQLRELSRQKGTLEDVFVEITHSDH
ncbi:MAG: ATP-binding cassette domain-containing protein [Chthoniobacterales bacterium]